MPVREKAQPLAMYSRPNSAAGIIIIKKQHWRTRLVTSSGAWHDLACHGFCSVVVITVTLLHSLPAFQVILFVFLAEVERQTMGQNFLGPRQLLLKASKRPIILLCIVKSSFPVILSS